MFKGLTTLKIILPLLLLLSACSDEPADPITEPENKTTDNTQEVTNAKATVEKELTAKIQHNDVATQSVIQDDSSTIKKEATQDYSNRKIEVLDIAERSFDGGNAIAVTLSVPLNPAVKHDDYFSLTRQSDKNSGASVDDSIVLSKNNKVVYFPFVEPSSSYKLTVYKGLTANNGSKLQKDALKEIETRSVIASYNFASKGSFLPLNQHNGLPIELVNIKDINVDYFKVPEDKVVEFLANQSDFQDKIHRYYVQDSISRSELVYSARYPFNAPKNKRRTYNLPIQNIEALSSPGIYLAVMTQPTSIYEEISMTHFMVTDIGMHVRVYKGQLEVALNSLTDQKPLSGVKVTLLNNSGKQIDQFKSSPGGFGTLRTKNDAKYIVAHSGSSISVVPLTGPALDLSEFTLAHRPFVADEVFVYSARDLYRPGESIDFNALLRDKDGQLIKPIPLKASIKDPSGQTAKHFTWRSDSDGYFHQNFTIPRDAKTGTWLLEISKHNKVLTTYQFKVEEFLPERLKLTFNQSEKAKLYQLNEKLTVNVLGEYLYGAPASGNRFESRIVIKPQRQPFDSLIEKLKGFQFGNVIEENLSQQYKLSDVKLDSKGKTAITIENRWSKVKSPVQVTLQASLYETGGRAISRRHQTTIISGDNLVGIKPHFKANPEHNSRVAFDVVTTNAKGVLTKNAALDVKLVREDRRYFWEFNNSKGWHYRWSDSEFIEYNSAVDTNSNKASRLEVPVEYGRYRLEVSDPATKAMTSVQFFAGYDWYSSWADNQSSSQAARPDKVSLAWDKESYNVGDVAQLSIVPPKAGEALLLIESDKLLHSQRITIPKEGLNVAVTIDEKWQRHDIYASVVHLQYGDNKKRITPTRAIGLIHLPLNREPRKLKLEIESAEEIYPNQTYQVKVKVEGHANQRAKLTLAMVDLGVLSLTDFKTPDAHTYFFEPRRFQVDSRDLYQNLIELNDAPLAKQKFGGDAALSRGGKKAQAEVQILSLFSGLVTVDKNGYATVPFEIPDFNGRVRLMAMAFTDDQFGSTESEMTIAAPIVSQIAMPRFLATDDQSTFALDLHNSTEQTQTLTVALTTTKPVVLNGTDSSTSSKSTNSQEITLASKEKTTLIYPVTVDDKEGRSKISLSVSGVDGYPVDRYWHIAVRSAYPALIEYKNTTLAKDESFNFTPSDYAHLKPGTLEAVLSANNMVEFNSREQMKHLLRYPYGCLEQSTSSTYPWLYANKALLDSLELKNSTNKNRLESINHGLSRIQAKALKNGGYGLWSNTSQEEHWLTAYVGDFLTDAKEQGIDVNRKQYENTMARLTNYLSNRNGTYSNRWSESTKHYDFAYRAYAGYVLSRHNKASLSKLRDLAKRKSEHAESQLALVHLALALKNQGDDVNSQAMFDKAIVLERGTKYLSDYGSVIRDQALIIHLLIKHKFQVDYAFDTALALSKLLINKKYLSTQERNALFLASISLEQGEQKEWQGELLFNQAKSTIKKAGAYTQKLSTTDLLQTVSLTNTSDERLFINFAYQGVSKVKPKATTGDLTIERDYYDNKGATIDASKLKVGDLVLVAVRVYSERRSPDLLVVDLLPAGLELENQNLTHAIKLDSIIFDGKPASEWQKKTKILHQEFRDDRYVAAIDVGYSGTSYLFYLARAVTPGKYKVPAPLVENMYQPDKNAVGDTLDIIEITNQ